MSVGRDRITFWVDYDNCALSYIRVSFEIEMGAGSLIFYGGCGDCDSINLVTDLVFCSKMYGYLSAVSPVHGSSHGRHAG